MSERKRGERRGENWTWVCLECCYCCSMPSHVQLSVTPWTAALQAFLSFTVSQSLLKLMSIELVMLSTHLILCLPLLPLPSNLCQHQSFPMSLLFASGGQSIGASASASVLPMNIQGWFPLGLTGWISLQSKGLSRVFSPAPQFESINSSVLRLLYVQISYNEDTTTYFPSHGHPSSRTSFPHWAGKLASWFVIVQNSHWATFYQQTWSTVPKRVKLSALLLPCTWVVKVRPLPRDVISLFLFFHVALIDEWMSPSLFPD